MAVIRKRKWSNASGDHVAWRLDFTDKHGVRYREQFPLKRDAEDRLAELQGTTRAGTYRPLAGKSSVSDACVGFLDYMEGRAERREKVTRVYFLNTREHIQNYVDPHGDYVPTKDGKPRLDKIGFKGGIGSIKLAELTAARVIKFRDDIRRHGVSVVTTRRILGTLSRLLKHAVESDMCVINVAKGIRVIGTRDEGPTKIVPPSHSDLAALLKAADSDEAIRAKYPDGKLRVQFAAATGLRASEQWALRWRNLDLDAGKVTVESRIDALGVIDTTKSTAGQRSVPIGRVLSATLAARRKATKFSKDDDFVFPDRRGGYTRHTNFVRRLWKDLIAAAKIEPIGWHALRHFAVSSWIHAGLQPKAVQTLAGHATYAITMDRYGHLFPTETHQTAFDKLSEALA